MARTVRVSATSLFRVAAEQYGDASQWWRLARANGLVDPLIPGAVTLAVPPGDPATTGDGIPLDAE